MKTLYNTSDLSSSYGRVNRRLFYFHCCASLWILICAPIAARIGGSAWGYSALFLALFANNHWLLLHEAIHGNLDSDRTANKSMGRALAIAFGSSFRFLRFWHLAHHQFNRHPLDRPDSFDPSKGPLAWPKAYAIFLLQTLGLHYLGEVLLPATYWLSERNRGRLIDLILRGESPILATLRHQSKTALGSERAVAEIRRDSLISLSLLALSVILWGKNLPFFLIAMGVRAFLISFFDNLYHFRTPINRPDFARNLYLPAYLRKYLFNSNLHQVHHRQMHLPWWQLENRFAEEKEQYHGHFFTAALSQFQGPAPESRLMASKLTTSA